MEVKVERINGANAKAEAKVSAAFLEEKKQKMAKEAAKNMKIDGFRQGKVPVHVVLARHGDQIKQDVEQEALRLILDNALKELDLTMETVIGEPQITKMDRNDDGLLVEVIVSFRPIVVVDGYEELIPEHKTPRVTKKEIAERVETMLKLTAPLVTLEEQRAVQGGDFVQIDFEGFIDGVAFEGGKAENYTLEIGSNSFIPGFEDGIVGMNIGDEKDIAVDFPQEYGSEELAGKPAIFKVKLQGIQTKKIPETADEATLKKLLPGVENPTQDTLEEQVKDQIRNEKRSKLFAEELKPKFVESILAKFAFDLPSNIVDQEIDMQVRNIFGSMSEEDIKAFSEDPKKIDEKREEYRKDAQDSVRLTFLVDELAKIEKISVQDQEIMQMIYFEAMQQGQDPKQYFEYYQKQGLLPAIKMSIIEERLFAQIFDKNNKGE
ncbi:MAG: trigger factor [Sulfurospirillum sp.]|nr:trigger factor [Sulfurospirillum sp.]